MCSKHNLSTCRCAHIASHHRLHMYVPCSIVPFIYMPKSLYLIRWRWFSILLLLHGMHNAYIQFCVQTVCVHLFHIFTAKSMWNSLFVARSYRRGTKHGCRLFCNKQLALMLVSMTLSRCRLYLVRCCCCCSPCRLPLFGHLISMTKFDNQTIYTNQRGAWCFLARFSLSRLLALPINVTAVVQKLGSVNVNFCHAMPWRVYCAYGKTFGIFDLFVQFWVVRCCLLPPHRHSDFATRISCTASNYPFRSYLHRVPETTGWICHN